MRGSVIPAVRDGTMSLNMKGNSSSADIPSSGMEGNYNSAYVESGDEDRDQNHDGHSGKTTNNTQGVLANGQDTAGQQDWQPESSDPRTSGEDCPDGEEGEVEEVKPIWLCSMIVRHPGKCFGIVGGLHLALTVLTGILYVAGYDILPIDLKNIPLNLLNDDSYQRAHAWLWRDESGVVLPGIFSSEVTPVRTIEDDSFSIMYDMEGSGKNIFTPERLRQIQEAEDKLLNIRGARDFCWSDENGDCKKPMSVINFFDGTYADVNSTFNDPNFENIVEVVYATRYHDITRNQLQYHLGRNSIISRDTAFTDITRSLFSTGVPMAGYKNSADRKNEQDDKREDWFLGDLRKALMDMTSDDVGDMSVIYSGASYLILEMERQIPLDLALALGSGGFISIFLVIQTRSLFITIMAQTGIISAFIITNMLYRIAFDYIYFGIFQMLAMFIILGIGADNIFVFYDTWRASAHEKFNSLEHRLSDCYRRSASAMFVTSLTTMIAFFASALSPLLLVHSFGVFAGVLVFINYLTSITLFPTVVIFYHLKWENWSWPCIRNCPCKKLDCPWDPAPGTPSAGTNGRMGSLAVDDPASEHQNKKATKQKNIVIRFFAGPFYRFVTHKIARWFILAFYLVLVAVLAYFAALLRPQENAFMMFIKSHNFGKARSKLLGSFMPNFRDNVVQVSMIWGLEEPDRSRCHKTDFNCHGKTVWDRAFDLDPPPAQMALLDFCERLRSLTDEENKMLRVRKDVNGNYEVKCFLENMEKYLQEEMKDPKYGMTEEFKLPATAEKIQKLMRGNPQIYDTSVLTDTFYRYFEVALDYWLSNGYGDRTYDYDEYYYLVGESKDPDSTPVRLANSDDFYGNRLRYASIVVNTSMVHVDQGYVDGLKIVEAWEDFLNEEKAKMPASLSRGFQCTPELGLFDNEWHWLNIQRVLVRSAWQGIVIGMSVALVVLILASQNVIVGLLATLTICFITCSVVGLIYLNGWKLSVLESTNTSLVVGLSVDYVVHLAAGYHFAKSKDRRGRVQEMLEDVGVSVLSGALTTIGAAFFMLFALIAFYMQFGIFMICTIGTSIFFALGFFSTILGIIGPENETGSLRQYTRKVKELLVKVLRN